MIGTLIAVGAGPTMSRHLAAVQAGLLTAIGTVLGAVIGLGIGAPLAAASTGACST